MVCNSIIAKQEYFEHVTMYSPVKKKQIGM